MTYLYKRGGGAKRRVMHLATYDRRGKISGTWCGRCNYDTAINVPLGQPVCKRCRKASESQP